MLLDFSKPFDVNKGRTRLEYLILKEAKIDLTQKHDKRSVDQNSYFHAVITIFAVEYGETMRYVKERMFKHEVNPEIFIYERVNKKTSESRPALRSSAELTTKEMGEAIDRFLIYASNQGIYIMTADEYKQNYFLVKQMKEANKEYL